MQWHCFSNNALGKLQTACMAMTQNAHIEVSNAILPAAGTFHSVGCQIVRRHVQQLGDTGREIFAILDQDDTKNVMKLALKKHAKLQKGIDESELAAEADDKPDSQLPEWVRGQFCKHHMSFCTATPTSTMYIIGCQPTAYKLLHPCTCSCHC